MHHWLLARAAALATVVAGAFAFVGSAAASPPASNTADVTQERVLIRVVPNDEQLRARLRAELGVLGLTAVVLDVPEQAPTLGPDLLDELPPSSASAAIEIVLGDNRIDLWVADGNTGKTLNRRLDLTLDPELADSRTVAIAAVELLRASRLELEDAPDTQDLPPEQPRDRGASQADEGERPPREYAIASDGAISLGPLVGGSPGGFGVTTHIEIAGRWAPLDRFALRASLWLPTLGSTATVTGGRARLYSGMLFVEPQLLLPSAKWFHPELGLGLGLALYSFEGSAVEGLRGVRDVIPGFAGHGHLGLGFAVIPRLWIRLDGYVGVVQPQPLLKPIDSDVVDATWGLPFASGGLGLEIWL